MCSSCFPTSAMFQPASRQQHKRPPLSPVPFLVCACADKSKSPRASTWRSSRSACPPCPLSGVWWSAVTGASLLVWVWVWVSRPGVWVADKDKNQSIDLEELKECLAELQVSVSEAEMRQLFEEADMDCSNGVQVKEFILLMAIVHLLRPSQEEGGVRPSPRWSYSRSAVLLTIGCTSCAPVRREGGVRAPGSPIPLLDQAGARAGAATNSGCAHHPRALHQCADIIPLTVLYLGPVPCTWVLRHVPGSCAMYLGPVPCAWVLLAGCRPALVSLRWRLRLTWWKMRSSSLTKTRTATLVRRRSATPCRSGKEGMAGAAAAERFGEHAKHGEQRAMGGSCVLMQ